MYLSTLRTSLLSSVWGCFEYAALHFLVRIFWYTKEHISPWYILGSGIADHRVCLYSVSVDDTKHFSKVMVSIYTAITKTSQFWLRHIFANIWFGWSF